MHVVFFFIAIIIIVLPLRTGVAVVVLVIISGYCNQFFRFVVVLLGHLQVQSGGVVPLSCNEWEQDWTPAESTSVT